MFCLISTILFGEAGGWQSNLEHAGQASAEMQTRDMIRRKPRDVLSRLTDTLHSEGEAFLLIALWRRAARKPSVRFVFFASLVAGGGITLPRREEKKKATDREKQRDKCRRGI